MTNRLTVTTAVIVSVPITHPGLLNAGSDTDSVASRGNQVQNCCLLGPVFETSQKQRHQNRAMGSAVSSLI